MVQAIDADFGPLTRTPRITVDYGGGATYSDLTLPRRAFDGHIRAGTVGGQPTTATDRYRSLRDASPANARALLETSPATLVFGGWDSSRKSRQGRWRSALVGEITGFIAGDATRGLRPEPASGVVLGSTPSACRSGCRERSWPRWSTRRRMR